MNKVVSTGRDLYMAWDMPYAYVESGKETFGNLNLDQGIQNESLHGIAFQVYTQWHRASNNGQWHFVSGFTTDPEHFFIKSSDVEFLGSTNIKGNPFSLNGVTIEIVQHPLSADLKHRGYYIANPNIAFLAELDQYNQPYTVSIPLRANGELPISRHGYHITKIQYVTGANHDNVVATVDTLQDLVRNGETQSIQTPNIPVGYQIAGDLPTANLPYTGNAPVDKTANMYNCQGVPQSDGTYLVKVPVLAENQDVTVTSRGQYDVTVKDTNGQENDALDQDGALEFNNNTFSAKYNLKTHQWDLSNSTFNDVVVPPINVPDKTGCTLVNEKSSDDSWIAMRGSTIISANTIKQAFAHVTPGVNGALRAHLAPSSATNWLDVTMMLVPQLVYNDQGFPTGIKGNLSIVATGALAYYLKDEFALINVIDDTTGKTINTVFGSGKYGQSITWSQSPSSVIASYQSQGYTLASNMVPNNPTLTDDFSTNTYEIHLKHGTLSVPANSPILDGMQTPSGVLINGAHESDLNKTVVRTIILKTPGQANQTVTQEAHLTRSAMVDEVTGDVTYGDWSTSSWATYMVPVKTNYTADQTSVALQTVNKDTKNTTVVVNYAPIEKKVSRNYTVTRTINYLDANGQALKPATVQSVQFTRTGLQNLATQVITWTDPAAQSFVAINDVNIPHYVTDTKNVPSVTVNWNDQNLVVNISYRLENSTVTVYFVDGDGHVIASKALTGQIGSTVDLNMAIPDGWVAYAGELVPTKIVIGENPVAVNFGISHRQVLVCSSQGFKAGDTIPGTIGKIFDDQINADHLITHAAYTVNIWADTSHTRKLQTKTYHTDFIRNAVVDAVTGEVRCLNWSENGQHVFRGFTWQAQHGYQALVVPSWTATVASPTNTIDLVAHPQELAGTIIYQTVDGHIVKSQAFTGNASIVLAAPDGYVLMTGGTTVTPIAGKDQNYVVYVRPMETSYTVADNLPAGVQSLSKIITRTIRITEANGHVRTIMQRVHFTRMATVKADGTVTYTDWKAAGRAVWNKIFIPKRHGYYIVVDGDLSKQNVTADMSDSVIEIKYVKN